MTTSTHVRTILVAAALVAVAVAALPTGGAPVADAPATETNVSSGEALSGAFAAHGADLEGDVEQRALSAALSRAGGDRDQAALLSERRVDVERRVERLADRRERLRASRKAGNVSTSAYRVRMTTITAEAEQLRRLLESVARESRTLPDSLRRTYGLDASSLNRSIARFDASIGAELGTSLDGATDASRDGDGVFEGADGANATVHDRTEQELAEANATHRALASRFERLAASGADPVDLACASENLTSADAALQRAVTALAADDGAETEAALVDARTSHERARDCLEDAAVTTDQDGDSADDGSGTADGGYGSDVGDGEATWNGSYLEGSDPTWNGTDDGSDSGWNDSDTGSDSGWNDSDVGEDDAT